MNLSCQVKLFSPDTHGRESIIFSVLNIRSKQSQRVRQQANGTLLHALAACKRPVSGRNGTESGKETNGCAGRADTQRLIVPSISSEEARVGKGGVRSFSSRWAASH